jgi:hypothetical protein
LDLVEYLLRHSTKIMELGLLHYFFEQIHSRAAEAGCVSLTILGAELVFLDPELCGALPNTP